MIIVGYMYNNNGMATWCIETAMALHAAGEKVLLVKSVKMKLPLDFPAPCIDFDYEETRSFTRKISDKIFKYVQLLPLVPMRDNVFLGKLHQHLQSQSLQPKFYLLNQTNLASKNVTVPQYVVGWAYGPFLKNYIKKAFSLSNSIKSLSYQMQFHLYWYKADWVGYRIATGVLAVSERLKEALKTKDIQAFTLYPGVGASTLTKAITSQKNKPTFALMAINLEDERKGLKPIICALKKLSPWQFNLVLIGGYTEVFKNWVTEGGFPATFTGMMKREQAVDVLNDCDVLLFGSLVDDWGYVQVEAMARGMAVMSPDASPFDEIVGRADYLYDVQNETSLLEKIKAIISTNNLLEDKKWFHVRYLQLFSSGVMSKKLLNILNAIASEQ